MLLVFVYGTITLYGRTFQTIPLTSTTVIDLPHNPAEKNLCRFGLYPISLATTIGISFDFFSYRYLDVSVP